MFLNFDNVNMAFHESIHSIKKTIRLLDVKKRQYIYESIKGGEAYAPSTYAPEKIPKSMFLPLKKSSHGGRRQKKALISLSPGASILALMKLFLIP